MAVVVVVTNVDKFADRPTGYYLPEVAHPLQVFRDAGLKVLLASPSGGASPMDPQSKEAFAADPICAAMLADEATMNQLANTTPVKDVDASQYQAVFYAGGHGPMFDFPDCEASNNLATKIYEAGGVVSAVCHGTVGLLNAKLASGEYLVKGHQLTSFTNDEENLVQAMQAMPFPLETRLKEHGATFVGAPNFAKNVQVSGRVVTGQNPASATGAAEEVVKLVKA